MGKSLRKNFICVALLCLVAVQNELHAGDEDVKANAQPKVETPVVEEEKQVEPESQPDLALGEDPGPEYADPSAPAAAPAAPAPGSAKPSRKKREPFDPDKNLDYDSILSGVDPVPVGRGILPPALGVRGYMPSMMGLSLWDRTPGYGFLVEYSWNRLGWGGYVSYRPVRVQYDATTGAAANSTTNVNDPNAGKNQTFFGTYLMYRWLPFEYSPFFHLGIETGSNTIDTFGGIAGVGFDARIYQGWTLFLGYTYHSVIRKGFAGGGMGWSF